MFDWRGTGVSVMEISHRHAAVAALFEQVERDLRTLLAVPADYRILLTQAPPTALAAIIPMNLAAPDDVADFVHTGAWSGRFYTEAQKYLRPHLAVSSEYTGFTDIPPQSSWELTPFARYVHLCTNETIHGVEFFFTPETNGIPLVADMSSHLLSRVPDVARYGAIIAGAQKNMGIAGVSVVIVQEALLGKAQVTCPSVFDWRKLADASSLLNTPPVHAVYIASLVLEWIKAEGGVDEMERRAIAKSAHLYRCIDASALYINHVRPHCRSRMNVPFFLSDPSLTQTFLSGAERHGLLGLAGHRSLGGIRASLYNAMPMAGIEKLVEYMREFERSA
jgi:phosphoserine aminotransferase